MTFSFGGSLLLRTEELFPVPPGNPTKLRQAVDRIDPPPGVFIHREKLQIRRRAGSLFVSGLKYAAARGSANAQQIVGRIETIRGTPQGAITAPALTALAREIGANAKADPELLSPLEGAGKIVDLQVPAAMDLLMQVAVRWGDSPLGMDLRDLLVVHARYAGDTYVIGHCLLSNQDVGRVLIANPWVGAARLRNEVVRDPGRQAEKARRVRALNGRFASAVSMERWLHLYGAET